MGVKTGPRRALASVALLLVLGGVACASAEATLLRDGNETFAEEDWEEHLIFRAG